MNRLLALAGIDAIQWFALTRIYLLMDFRRSGGATRTGSAGGQASPRPIVAMLVGAVLNSVMIALIVFLVRDPLTAAVGMVSMAAITISLLLLVDFAGSVVAAEDYWVLAPRPVSSRTYFAARLAAVLAYVTVFALVMSLVPAFVFLAWHRLGPGAFVGAIAATVLSSIAGAAVVIGIYTTLMAHVRPGRLVAVMSGVHLFASMLSMSGFLFVMKGFEDARIRDLSVGDFDWFWYIPTTWFAAIVPALAGTGGVRETLAAAGATVMTFAVVPLACGRLSLDMALQISEATGSVPSTRGRALERIPGFGRGEAYAVATLIRAQFRYDLRFRLAILGVLPMTFFYLFLGWDEGLRNDPFVSGVKAGGPPIYMALAFLPMILHSALQSSDQWRAAWIFWATPADPARLVVASKNFVAVFVLGPYLMMMAGIWAAFYDRFWHALVHAAVLGAGAHLLLQAAVILNPELPFAKEPKRAAQSARLFGLFFIGLMFSSLGPMLLPLVYPRPAAIVILALMLAALTGILERTLHRRARAHFDQLENP
jgi:hypothetical protein